MARVLATMELWTRISHFPFKLLLVRSSVTVMTKVTETRNQHFRALLSSRRPEDGLARDTRESIASPGVWTSTLMGRVRVYRWMSQLFVSVTNKVGRG